MNTSPEPHVSSVPASPNKACPVLLVISLCLSAVLCWMYVTKPVIVAASSDEKGSSVQEVTPPQKIAKRSETKQAKQTKQAQSELLPSDNALPGVKTSSGASSKKLSATAQKPIDPLTLTTPGNGTGWETTNARVQHILRADSGNGELSNIVLNVPVLYQTRTMRWTPADIANGRQILTRLMVYESNLAKVKQEGKVLLADWHRLLEKTVPSSALRADSPSIPYNRTQRANGQTLPGGNDTIKVE